MYKKSEKASEGVHITRYETTKRRLKIEVLLLSDLHWDNPDCNRKLLRQHLDLALANGYRILLNGDTFCLMQGKYDPRSSKSKVRPEHQVDNYLDAIVDTAVEWFAPYAHLIDIVGYGNHETSVLKRQETDLLKRFVYKINKQTGSKIGLGGYGGWWLLKAKISGANTVYRIKYFHGSGGGGKVTKGMINLTRACEMYDGFDCFTMGHVHEIVGNHRTMETVNNSNKIVQKDVLLTITGTYKDEYKLGTKGWHVERGAPPKPVGGTLLTVEFYRKDAGMQVHAQATRLLPF